MEQCVSRGLVSDTSEADLQVEFARKLCYTYYVLHINRALRVSEWRSEISKNVTIRLDDSIVRKCRHAAIEEDKSLSQWIADLMVDAVSAADVQHASRERALRRLEKGFALGGTPLSRDEIYGD